MKLPKRQKPVSRKFVSLSVLALGTLLVLGFTVIPKVSADQFDAQIKALQQDNAAKLNIVNNLQNQAQSYQDVINNLQSQINALQAQINANQAKQNDLQNQINANEQELEHQKSVLGQNIHVMYVEGQISTIEMLATSKNLSDFVDKEEYHTAVKNQIQATLTKIAELQNELNTQKQQVEQLLADQRSQQSQLDANRNQQAALLAMNTQQQASYNDQIKQNQSQISSLRAQQAAENARLFSGSGSHIIAGNNGNDTYPNTWRNAAQDSMIDNWGMFNRECVSYTAWKVYESGRHMPYWGGSGNANQWPGDARAAGIPVDGNPRVGDVAIKPSGPYGHAMYVEHVYSDGSIYVSQYNAQLNGTYSEAIISAAGVQAYGLEFIHF